MNKLKRRWTGSRVAAISALGIFVTTLGISDKVQAQDWSFAPTVTMTAEYNDNARLRVDSANRVKLEGGTVRAGARLSRLSPTGSMVFIPSASTNFYRDNDDAESDDYSFLFDGEHRAQRSTWSFIARYDGQQLLTAELLDPDFDNPDIDRPLNDDSGIVQQKDRRIRFYVSPSVEFEVSERTTFGLAADYTDTSYDENLGGLEDYTFVNLDAYVERRLSQKNSVSFTVFANTYERDTGEAESDSVGASVRFSRRLTEKDRAYAFAGYQETDTERLENSIVTDRSDGALIAGAGYIREFEVSRLVVDLRRAVNPTGIGLLTERVQARAHFSHQLSPTLTGEVLARYIQEDTVPDSTTRPDRDFGQLTLSLRWLMNRDWALIGTYIYSEQDFSTQTRTASSNAFRLGIRYAPRVRRR